MSEEFFTEAVVIGAGAIGLELRINGHFSVEGDLGGEHFFNLDGVIYKGQYTLATDLFVPTLGVVGRM